MNSNVETPPAAGAPKPEHAGRVKPPQSTSETVRLIILSNRLPSMVEKHEGAWRVLPGSGGLVTAMALVLRDRGGTWIGWAGTLDDDDVDLEGLLAEGGKHSGYTLKPVVLTREEKDKFYNGFSNEIIWPLFHSLDERCNFDPAYWETYQRVNRKFAEVAKSALLGGDNTPDATRSGSYIWVHDYHLMMVATELRRLEVRSRMGFFLHIPFPPLDIFLKLPWRFQVLRGLLAYDLVGFQTVGDRRNFVHCVRTLLKDVSVTGRGRVQTVKTPSIASLLSGAASGAPRPVASGAGSGGACREVRIGTFPISIDFAGFARHAASPAVERHMALLKEQFSGRKIILGVDRLDYTKGIPHRLKAFRNALVRYPELRRNVTMVQVVVPSREAVPAYQHLKEQIDELVGEINGEHTQPGWVPIHYLFRSLCRDELLAYYRIADVGLVTPLKDGMNLVAKEYCACNRNETGVLVLSEFAGAAAELQHGALLVNPYDIEGVADAIYQALTIDPAEGRRRMGRLRRTIRQRDITWWLECTLQASFATAVDDSPPADLYVPTDRPDPSTAALKRRSAPWVKTARVRPVKDEKPLYGVDEVSPVAHPRGTLPVHLSP